MAEKESLFREQAVKSRNEFWTTASYLPRGIPWWVVSMGTMLFILATVIFLVFGTYNRRVIVSGEIISEPRAVSIFATQQGYVGGQFVQTGDRIEKGQTLYQIDTSRKTSSGVVSDSQKKNLIQQLSTLDDIIGKTEDNRKVTIDSLQKQVTSYQTLRNQFRESVRGADVGLHFMEKNMENYRSYLSRGLINKEQLVNQMSIYYQRQNDMLSLKNQDSQFELQLINLQASIKTQEAEFDNQINKLLLQKSEVQRQLTDADANGAILIAAPASGRVESVSVTPGEMVSPGDSLLQILPGKVRRYILVLWIPGHAAPYVSPGDKVNLRYEAFPAEKFGQFPGHILSVSAVPASGQEMSTYPSSPLRATGSGEVWYKLQVIPDSDGFLYRGKKFTFSNGMKASCVLFLDKRKLYQWIFSPLYDITNSTKGPINASQ